MTVDELIELLQKESIEGKGNFHVVDFDEMGRIGDVTNIEKDLKNKKIWII